ncbi:MAG: hypothetical protein WD530_04250 [Vicingaceae bacterium]
MRKLSLCLSILMLCVTQVNAQSKALSKKEKKIFKEADSYYEYGDYLTAKSLFMEVYYADSSDSEINFKIGDSHYKLKEYEESLPFLQEGISYNKDAKYMIAKVHLYMDNLKQARLVVKEYMQTINTNFSIYTQKDLNQLLEKINYAEKAMSNPDVVNIVNLGNAINTENAEYVPLISSDESILIFTSRRFREGKNEMDPTGRPFEDIYISKRTSSGAWSKAIPIPGDVNTPKHDACVGLSPDGQRLFTYKSHENLIGGDIYESIFQDGEWMRPVRMSANINNEFSIEPSASLSLDGKTFYFSSNREGGFGGFDIYRVKLLPHGEWSLPKNLGPTVNTEYDDDAPFIHPDGHTLYFSSKGHQNMGGYDVFKTNLIEEEEWSQPENLGYPTNTTKDDIYFVISANERHGYYASDKAGGFGEHDIYMIDYLERSLRQSVVRGNVSDAESGENLRADISLLELASAEVSGTYISKANSGDFIFLVNPDVEYEIMVEVEGYEPFVEEISFSVDDLIKPQAMEFKLKAVEVEKEVEDEKAIEVEN